MNFISEVEGGRPGREFDNFSERGKHIHISVKDIVTQRGDIIFRVLIIFFAHADEIPEPVKFLFNIPLFLFRVIVFPFFVAPVSSDPAFRDSVHLFRSNLDFIDIPVTADDRGV